MAEYFLFNIAESVLVRLGSSALKEIFLVLKLEHDLEQIHRMLLAIKAVLCDAEQRRSQNEAIGLWLGMLKDVLYDTEDVIDEFECEALRKQVVKSGRATSKVRRFFSASNPLAYRCKMAQKVKKIRERVAEIAALKSDFGLTERINDNYVRKREMTHSFVDASDVIGRDQDKENIIQNLLISDDNENVSVIPIVGIGGLGKTTLAKFVYNDQRVVTHFGLKLWVCVSEEFDLRKMIIKILNCVGTVNMDMDLEQLQIALRDALHEKRYLLVLDDVWNEDQRKWLDLKTLLMGGANGSKILVTTRSDNVASIMGTVSYDLRLLPHEYCLSLFFKCAFREAQDKQNPNLLKIGEEIVSKCKGVPLAVITLGTLLNSAANEHDWEVVRDSEIWKLRQQETDILPALKLSYEHMPSYLKRCFAYCSIFPKDYEFNNFQLVYFWMSHGLVESPHGNEELEDVGFRYFRELCSRFFFQEFREFGILIVECKMHDLIHDLALSVTQNECLSVISFQEPMSKSIRHLSFPYPELLPEDLPKPFQDLDSVRTICFLNVRYKGISSEKFIKTCISRFRYLRFLDLSFSKITVLPESIGKLKHLRYLSLMKNREIKRLPNSICNLQSLEFLNLLRCTCLEELPRDIKYMIKLRFFWVTTEEMCLPTGGICCLESLRSLFIARCYNLKYLSEDIHCLKRLRTLSIRLCPELVSLPPSLKCLPALENLDFGHCDKLVLTIEEGKDSTTQFSLRKLEIEGLSNLVDFPEWLIRGSTNSLKVIRVKYCGNLRNLPDYIRNIPTLEEFDIQGCEQLQETGAVWRRSTEIISQQ